MNPGRSSYNLRERKRSRLDNEDSQTDSSRPRYMKPWIVPLLLKYNESEARPDVQVGQVLKVLNEASAPHEDGQEPAAVVHISDGQHYIRAVVPARAIEAAKGFPQQPEFSSILGQFIVLQNFRVCLQEAARVEDSGFYLVLDSFCVTPMKKREMRRNDSNLAPSVLQKIKELWLRDLALKPLSSSEPSSVSEVLSEMKDKLAILKQNVEECLSSLDPSSVLDSEQLAVYPDTKWQMERKKDKMQHWDIFTVPAECLMIGAEDKAALSRSYPPKPSDIVSDNGEISTDDDRSIISFVSAEAETPDGSLENPWDIFPGMTLTSSKDTQPSLPNAQQMLLASPAEEEEAAGSSSCTSDILQSCGPTSHSSSARIEPVETTSPSLLPPDIQVTNQVSRSEALNTSLYASKISDIDDSIPCCQPLNNANSHLRACCLSPVCPTTGSTFSLKTLSGHVEKNPPVHSQKETVGGSGVGAESLETSRNCGAAKRKQLTPDEEESTEASSGLLHISHKAQRLTSATVFQKLCQLETRQVTQNLPLKFVRESMPKKSRRKEISVQQLEASARSRRAVVCLEKLKEPTVPTARLADACGSQLGVEQQERMRRATYRYKYQPPTAELCSQVLTTRISRAQLGWARWVFRNEEK